MVSDIVTWAEANWHPAALRGQPIALADHQRRILRHVFSRDDEGRFRYHTILWSEPKKSGKTEIGALVGYWLAREEGPAAEVYVLANDKDQSVGRVFAAMCRAARRFKAVKVQAEKLLLPDGSFVQALPCDYAGDAGANPVASIWDELWAYTSESGRRLWDEFTPVPTRLNSLRFIVTYAGFEGESELLEEMYKRGLKAEPVPELADLDNGDGEPACRAADGFFMFWSHKPRMPWQTEAYYAAQRSAPGFRPNAYLRVHENRWVSNESSFAPVEWWDAAAMGGHPVVANRELRVVLGVDAGLKRDSAAVTACVFDFESGRVRLVAHRVFTPQPGETLDIEDTLEAAVRDFAERFSVVEVRYDPWQFQRSAQTLQKAGIQMVEFPQSVPNLTAMSSNLYELLKGGNLAAYPDDGIRLAMQRAVAIETSRGVKIAKEKASHKVDVVVALAMGALGAVQTAGPPAAGVSGDDPEPRWQPGRYGLLGRPSGLSIWIRRE